MQVIPQECAQARTSEKCENIPAPLIKEDTAEIVQVIPQGRPRARIVEQSVPVPGSPAKEGIAGVAQGLPPEHDQRRISEQGVLFPVPPIDSSSVPSVPTMFPAKWRMKRANTWSPPVLTRKEPGNPKSSPSQDAHGQPSLAEETRLQGRGLCGQPDASETDTSMPQRNPQISSASAEKPRLADPTLVNAKLTRAKANGMRTPAAESCIQDDLVVFPDPQTQGRLCLTATHFVEEFLKCAQAGMNNIPEPQLISRICGTSVDLSAWFDQARKTTAEQQCLAACRNLLDLKEECIRGCLRRSRTIGA